MYYVRKSPHRKPEDGQIVWSKHVAINKIKTPVKIVLVVLTLYTDIIYIYVCYYTQL
jgi:hypothetical protein